MPVRDDLQSTQTKHPIPQNVMDVEFKVVGEMTVKQFMYLVVGGIIVYLLSRSDIQSFWKWFFIIITGVTSLSIAFVPLQERSLDTWAINFIKSMINPTQRIWRKLYFIPDYLSKDYASNINSEIVTLTPQKSRNRLKEYLGMLPDELSDFDMDERSKLKQIKVLMDQTESVGFTSLPTNEGPVVEREETTITTIDTSKDEIQEKKLVQRTSNISPGNIEDVETVVQTVNLGSKKNGGVKLTSRQTTPVLNNLEQSSNTKESTNSVVLSDVKTKPDHHITNQAKDLAKAVDSVKKRFDQVLGEEVKLHRKNGLQNTVNLQDTDVNTRGVTSIKENEAKDSSIIEQTKMQSGKVTKKNVITGTVKNAKGDPISGAVALIKDEKGDVVKALQTDFNGTFNTGEPVLDGEYHVEVIKGGENFDIISVVAKGEEIPKIHMIAKE